MATANDIKLTGNPEIDQFIREGGSRLLPTEGNTYYWYMPGETNPANTTIEPITNELAKNMVRDALQQISNVININFKEVNYPVGATGGFEIVSGTDSFPMGGGADLHSGQAGITIKHLNNYSDTNTSISSKVRSTTMHEVLHLLGFDDGPINDNPDYTTVDSVMSYHSLINDVYGEKVRSYEFDENGSPKDGTSWATTSTLGIYDIQAIQSIYGANYNYNAGNTVYKYTPETLKNFQTIWDGGGIDTIDVSEFILGVELNLNDGTRSNLFIKDSSWNGWEYDGTRAIGIAYGANIENAIGGQGDDIIYGNKLDNIISGNDGNDKLYGGDGNDWLDGGSGTNTLYGGAGNDKLISHGSDTLYGGDGNDLYQIHGTDFRIIEEQNGGFDTIEIDSIYAATYVMPEHVENVRLNTGWSINSNLTGNDLNNSIHGNFGDNILIGGKGNDSLAGFRGSDTYIFSQGDGRDTIDEYNNNNVPATDTDILLFNDISIDQLWFSKYSSWGDESLLINVLGTTDQVTVYGWYSNNAKLEQIKTQDGVTLSIDQIESLVDIMASQTMPLANNSTIIDDYMMTQTSMIMG
ncbi:M10 family metallopeptidase C-terminal domain-containing protein [Budviciaceae bacterium BWR-B9]|uniref:M10 family metallopeptidase C-terminal domain-containing protein n=1 Tax=Limnobaculum allomyrinae TaxID=2791986 RepID=A0ABS1ILS0_9GAMM|nr:MULTISPECIES: M10 family metallopeptidase C-terminal domain-containing protein [Limnobaculum]MBK5142471.1 M10 family metallopeptidase C-terminal domain-containing protein [Limnobaculum allomyrinae]MBV7690644.1 M10 family metallopeptidase C-terminal domain-containing protein [Limnobaculum sp. M2-1]